MQQIENKKAFLNYEILERAEAGIALKGAEVKSLREQRASIKESFARVENGEMFIYSFSIQQYPNAREKIDPLRKKKLLLKKNEIAWFRKKTEQKGLTIVPLSVYFNKRGLAKISIGLARGKQLYDKRSDIKKREIDREIERKIKNRGAN